MLTANIHYRDAQCVAQEELEHLLRHQDTAGKPLLVFSNKKDRPDSAVGAVTIQFTASTDVRDCKDRPEVFSAMKFDKIQDRPIQIQ